MAFVDLVIHKGTTTDSFIIVEEMDSIKKNCRVISRKKKITIYHIISKQNKTNKKTTEKEISIWHFDFCSNIYYIHPFLAWFRRQTENTKKFKKKSELSYFSEDIRLRGAYIGGNPNIIYKMDALLTIVGPIVLLFVLFWEQF